MSGGAIRHGAGRIENQPQARPPDAVARVPLDPFDKELVEQIFRNHEAECPGGCHHVVDPSGRLRTKANVAERSFADGTYLELQAVGSGECRRAASAPPGAAWRPRRGP